MAQITFSLSDAVLAQAQEAGLLAPESLEQLLKDELRRRAFDRFFETSRRLQEAAAAEGLEPMTMDEIQEEVNAVRAERRAQAAAR